MISGNVHWLENVGNDDRFWKLPEIERNILKYHPYQPHHGTILTHDHQRELEDVLLIRVAVVIADRTF